MAQLQRIQNNSVWLIFHKKRSEHVTPLLISLRWLPIKQCIEYKLATLAFCYFDVCMWGKGAGGVHASVGVGVNV